MCSRIFQMGTEAESTQATIDIYEKEEAFEVDYSSLNEDLKVMESFLLFITHSNMEYLNITESFLEDRIEVFFKKDFLMVLKEIYKGKTV